jgi:putative nucleotidyltransferase with HDIG domain
VARKLSRFSLLAQPLDRAVFLAYFLGAVVPLAALGWFVRRQAHAGNDTASHSMALGLLASIGVLSLASFLVLRRTTYAALASRDRENQGLAHLLGASRALAVAADDQEVRRLAAETAALVASAASGHLLVRGRDGVSTPAASHPGPESPDQRETLVAAAEGALETMKPTLRGDASGGLAVGVPCSGSRREAAALVVWHDEQHPFEEGELPALSTLASLVTISLRNLDLHAQERNFFIHATNLLVATLDRYLGDRTDHSRRVARIANQVGRELDLPETRLERLHFAALLHDIGMLRVPREHLHDLEEVRRHAELGDEMLRPIRMWEDLAPIVRHHQEWFDGEGYPDRLRGDQIPLESRIISIAEAWDAMTAEKTYQHRIELSEAIDRLVAGAGTQFDPAIVQAFVRLRNSGALS